MIVMPYNSRPHRDWLSRLRLESWPSTWVRQDSRLAIPSPETRRAAIARAAAGFLAGGPVAVLEGSGALQYLGEDGVRVVADYSDDTTIRLALPGQDFRTVASLGPNGWEAEKGIPAGVVGAREQPPLRPSPFFFRSYRRIMAIRCGTSFLWPDRCGMAMPFQGPAPDFGRCPAPPEVARAKVLSCLTVAASSAAARAGTDEVALWAALEWAFEFHTALGGRSQLASSGNPQLRIAALRCGSISPRSWRRLARRLGFSRLLRRGIRLLDDGFNEAVTTALSELAAEHVSLTHEE